MTTPGAGRHAQPSRTSRDSPSRYDFSTVRLTFRSGGERCVGRLYRPDQPSNPPLVVLAGGPIASGGRPLAPYAERLAAAGYAGFRFDFRHAGDSDGEPRNLVSPARQRTDWEAALTGLRGRDSIATDRTVLWGVGVAADGALAVAADDPRISGVVAGTPILSGRAFLRNQGVRSVAGGLLAGVRDRLQSLVGRPHTVPVVADAADGSGRRPLVSTPNASRGYRRVAGAGGTNRTPGRSILALWKHTRDADRGDRRVRSSSSAAPATTSRGSTRPRMPRRRCRMRRWSGFPPDTSISTREAGSTGVSVTGSLFSTPQ